jgi:hypothetical protein
MIIRQGSSLIAVLEGYDGPVPRVGEYFIHPDLHDDGFTDPAGGFISPVAGCVKQVQYLIYTRPRKGEYADHFVKRPVPYVEVYI